MAEKKLKAIYQGEIDFNGVKISCAVLEDGTRVLVNRSLANAFGLKGGGAYWQRKKVQSGAVLPEYLSAKYLEPYISDDARVMLSTTIPYVNTSGTDTEGVPAVHLVDICDIFKQADENGAFRNNEKIGETAYHIILSLSKVGIIALIDEATGYQKDKDRAKDELQKFLSQFLSEERSKWVKTFDDSFFEMIYRMRGWTWTDTNKRPGVVGQWINDIVYDRIGPAVKTELNRVNPKTDKGYRKSTHHQHLTEDVGKPKLKEHLASIEALGRASGFDWNTFMVLLNRAFPKFEQQYELISPNDSAFLSSGDNNLSSFDKSLKQALDYNPKE